MSIISHILDSVIGIAGINEILLPRLLRPRLMSLPEHDRTRKFGNLLQIITLNYLIIIVRPLRIRINAIGHIQIHFLRCRPAGIQCRLERCNLRSYRNPVNPGTPVPVFIPLTLERIILNSLPYTYRTQHIIILRIHADAIHLVHIYNSYVKPRVCTRYSIDIQYLGNTASDLVVLALERRIDLPVHRIESHCPEMSLDTVYRSENIPFHIHLQEPAGERHIHTVPLTVIGNSLDMLGLAAHENRVREIAGLYAGGKCKSGNGCRKNLHKGAIHNIYRLIKNVIQI